jgi:hypothetical protein
MQNCIGPIINQKQLDKIRDQVDDAVAKGAKVLVGGKHKGLFFEPTILTNITRDMKVMREETFGPIAPVVTVGSVDEAIEVANDTEYACAGIMTATRNAGSRSPSLAHRHGAHQRQLGERRAARPSAVRAVSGTAALASTSSPRCAGSRRARRTPLPAAVLDESGALSERTGRRRPQATLNGERDARPAGSRLARGYSGRSLLAYTPGLTHPSVS